MDAGRLALLMAFACALGACNGPIVTLKNEQTGLVAVCRGGTVATGMTSERVAADILTKCVDDYTQQGYTVVAATQ
jgi:hypothetical protein